MVFFMRLSKINKDNHPSNALKYLPLIKPNHAQTNRLNIPKMPENIWHRIFDYLTLEEIYLFATVSKESLHFTNTYQNAIPRIRNKFNSELGLEYIRHRNLNNIDKYLLSIDKSFSLYQRYYRMISVWLFKIWVMCAICLIFIITPILDSISYNYNLNIIVFFLAK